MTRDNRIFVFPRWLPCALAGLLLCAGIPSAQAQGIRPTGRERWLLTETDAIMLAQPELVSTGDVKQTAWSPEGRYVLASRELLRLPGSVTKPPQMERELLLWSAETRCSHPVWTARSPDDSVGQFVWLPKADVAYALVTQAPPPPKVAAPAGAPPAEPQTWLLRIDGKRGLSRAICVVPAGSHLQPAPVAPLAVLLDGIHDGERVVRADGAVSAPLKLPGGEHEVATFRYWAEDGRSMAVQGVPAQRRKGDKATWYLVDPLTGAAQSQQQRIQAYLIEPPQWPWRVVTMPATLTAGKVRVEVHPVWVAGVEDNEQPGALLSPDAEQVEPSPRGDAILYVADGAAWVAPLVHAPKAAFYATRDAARRRALASEGKQLSTAALMYAQDYDETLPAAGQDVAAMLRPYVTRPEILGNLVYTFGGGNLASIENPSKTELGYLPGPGGRVVLYVDGHVAWKKDGE